MSNISYFIVRTFDNDQTETMVCTYNQNTYTLLYKLQRRDESKEQSVNITYLTIFASQWLPSAPLLPWQIKSELCNSGVSPSSGFMKYSPFALHHYLPMRTVVLLPVRRDGARNCKTKCFNYFTLSSFRTIL
jgi:hypothetical protein